MLVFNRHVKLHNNVLILTNTYTDNTQGGLELLMCHGFPIAPWSIRAAGITGEGDLNISNPQAAVMAGNSMHVTCVGLATLSCLWSA